MFSVEQKRSIADAVQRILRDTGHPELPVGEIQFKLYVHGRFQWSWADIRNNGAVPNPSVNPWNETQARGIPTEPQHGREPDKHELWCPHHPEIIRDGQLGECTCKPDKVKPLAQYLDEYIEHEVDIGNLGVLAGDMYAYDSWRELLEQALDAYQSTENVTIKIERV